MTDVNSSTTKADYIANVAPLMLQALAVDGGPNYNWAVLSARAIEAATALYTASQGGDPESDSTDTTT